MNSNNRFQDPYSKKDFWINLLSTKSHSELEECLNNFDRFTFDLEKEFRIVMSTSRAEICREALLDLLKLATRHVHN
ncbi:MAG: hypothetical protein ACE5HX_03280, partial [bacterium]